MQKTLLYLFLNPRSDNRKSKIENQKSVGIVALVIALVMCGAVATAQQPAKISRIGFLAPPTPSFLSTRVEAFRQGLRELGYLEGKNISIEYQYAEGKLDRLPQLATELVHLKVEVILTAGESGALAAKNATSNIPIVFAVAEDAVESGLVSSLARPGGNVTGLTILAADLGGKRLELLKESFPNAVRVALLWPLGGPRGNAPFTEMEAAAKALGLKLQSLPVRGLDDFESAFEAAKKGGAQALLISPSPLINTQRDQIVDFAAKNRLLAMYSNSEFVCASRRSYVLCAELARPVPAFRDLCRQDFQGRQACGSSCRAANQI